MKTLFLVTMSPLIISLVLIVGCAKSGNQKNDAPPAAAPAETRRSPVEIAVSDLTASLPLLIAKPDPSEKWSDEELNAYEELIRKNEDNLLRVQTYNKDGAKIVVQPSLREIRRILQDKTAVLQKVRDKKALTAAERAKAAQTDQLRAQYNADTNFLEGEGLPTQSWSKQRLDAYEAALSRVDQSLRDLKAANGDESITTARQKINDGRRETLDEVRKTR